MSGCEGSGDVKQQGGDAQDNLQNTKVKFSRTVEQTKSLRLSEGFQRTWRYAIDVRRLMASLALLGSTIFLENK